MEEEDEDEDELWLFGTSISPFMYTGCLQDVMSPLSDMEEADLRMMTVEEKWKIIFNQVIVHFVILIFIGTL